MLRFLTVAAAMAALIAVVPPAYAGKEKCPKVHVTFSCGNGTGGGPSPFKCNGLNEDACCKKWKKRAAKKWCRRKDGGLASFSCECPKVDEDNRSSISPDPGGLQLRPERPGTLAPSRPPRGRLKPSDPPARTLTPVDPPRKTLTPVDPPGRTLTPVDPPQKTLKTASCHAIEYTFTCFDGSSSSGRFKCGPKKLRNRCCRRAQTIAFRGCHGKGGNPIRFVCDCVPEKRPGQLRLRSR